jgi:hypothetical protein
MDVLETLDLFSLKSMTEDTQEKQAVRALENGKVLFFPTLPFILNPNEQKYLSPDILSPKSKNISYDSKVGRLGGTICEGEAKDELTQMLHRFAMESRKLVDLLIPSYTPHLLQGRTSFRPAQISGRVYSNLKNDTLLHVDSFPATPVKGKRILRVFSNVNPHNEPRVWKIGEPFTDIVKKMVPRINPPFPGLALLLKWFKITKDYRTLYDHYMLKIHNMMKLDPEYQKSAPQQEIHFPSGSTWIVFTDQAPHAALAGQYVLEHTLYIPSDKLYNPETSPLSVLEKFLHRSLI